MMIAVCGGGACLTGGALGSWYVIGWTTNPMIDERVAAMRIFSLRLGHVK